MRNQKNLNSSGKATQQTHAHWPKTDVNSLTKTFQNLVKMLEQATRNTFKIKGKTGHPCKGIEDIQKIPKKI
jgi:hypothetical protein